jgi:hypothetical protein
MLSGALIGHYNEKYSTLSENEKETLKNDSQFKSNSQVQ